MRPRLVAAGLSVAEIDQIIEPVLDSIQAVRSIASQYAQLRYYWTEYAPVVEAYREFRRGAR